MLNYCNGLRGGLEEKLALEICCPWNLIHSPFVRGPELKLDHRLAEIVVEEAHRPLRSGKEFLILRWDNGARRRSRRCGGSRRRVIVLLQFSIEVVGLFFFLSLVQLNWRHGGESCQPRLGESSLEVAHGGPVSLLGVGLP
jgi:hypothetical protein